MRFDKADNGTVSTISRILPALVFLVVAIIGIFVVLSIYGFFWALWNMGYSSYEFFSELDVTSPSGAVIALLSAFLVVATLYYVLFPEGQLARDAVAQRGAGRATFAHGDKRRA